MQVACTHRWEPLVMFGDFAKSCDLCGRWCQISKREFRRRFGGLIFRQAASIKRRQHAVLEGSLYWNVAGEGANVGGVEGLISQAVSVAGVPQQGGRTGEVLQRSMPHGRLESAPSERSER